jgi:prepilin-type N-terminal cleavage/methylation domain-containing protein
MHHLPTTGLGHTMKKNNKGFSLAEIAVALALFGILAIPVYMAFSRGAAEEINYDKVAAANKILESFKDEIKNLSFEYALDLQKQGTFTAIQGPPNTFNALLETQQKFKDFKLEGKAEKVPGLDIEAVKFLIEVSWTKGGGAKVTERISFVKVK